MQVKGVQKAVGDQLQLKQEIAGPPVTPSLRTPDHNRGVGEWQQKIIVSDGAHCCFSLVDYFVV